MNTLSKFTLLFVLIAALLGTGYVSYGAGKAEGRAKCKKDLAEFAKVDFDGYFIVEDVLLQVKAFPVVPLRKSGPRINVCVRCHGA